MDQAEQLTQVQWLSTALLRALAAAWTTFNRWFEPGWGAVGFQAILVFLVFSGVLNIPVLQQVQVQELSIKNRQHVTLPLTAANITDGEPSLSLPPKGLCKGTHHLGITVESCQIQWGAAVFVSMVCSSPVIHQGTYY